MENKEVQEDNIDVVSSNVDTLPDAVMNYILLESDVKLKQGV